MDMYVWCGVALHINAMTHLSLVHLQTAPATLLGSEHFVLTVSGLLIWRLRYMCVQGHKIFNSNSHTDSEPGGGLNDISCCSDLLYLSTSFCHTACCLCVWFLQSLVNVKTAEVRGLLVALLSGHHTWIHKRKTDDISQTLCRSYNKELPRHLVCAAARHSRCY